MLYCVKTCIRQFVTTPLHIPDIDVQCYEYEGIDAIKEALRAGIQQGTEGSPIKVSGYHLGESVVNQSVDLGLPV